MLQCGERNSSVRCELSDVINGARWMELLLACGQELQVEYACCFSLCAEESIGRVAIGSSRCGVFAQSSNRFREVAESYSWLNLHVRDEEGV